MVEGFQWTSTEEEQYEQRNKGARIRERQWGIEKTVEVYDRLGEGMEIIEYNKLVRDKIPEIIEADGKTAITMIIDGLRLKQALVKKLTEEGEEYLESLETEEIADLLEILHGLMEAQGVSYEEVEQMRLSKKEERGGFSEGLILRKVQS